jgi:hypothetical protein
VEGTYLLLILHALTTLEQRAYVKCFVSLQFLIPKTIGRTPWTGNQSVANINTEKTQTNTYALNGIRTYDPYVRPSEDILCLIPRGHCDRHATFF